MTNITDGMTFMKMMKNGHNVYEISDSENVSVEYINMCVEKVRDTYRQDAISTNIKVVLAQPIVKVFNSHSGVEQDIEVVELQLMKPIFIHYSDIEETEHTAMLPIKIKIKRN